MPLPEKMSVSELEEEIKKQPDNQGLKEILNRKKMLFGRKSKLDWQSILRKDAFNEHL